MNDGGEVMISLISSNTIVIELINKTFLEILMYALLHILGVKFLIQIS